MSASGFATVNPSTGEELNRSLFTTQHRPKTCSLEPTTAFDRFASCRFTNARNSFQSWLARCEKTRHNSPR